MIPDSVRNRNHALDVVPPRLLGELRVDGQFARADLSVMSALASPQSCCQRPFAAGRGAAH